jgi:hypothetical protein
MLESLKKPLRLNEMIQSKEQCPTPEVALSLQRYLGVALLTDRDFLMPNAKKLTISGWCRKRDILWAEGLRIPDEWWDLSTREDYVKLVEKQKVK